MTKDKISNIGPGAEGQLWEPDAGGGIANIPYFWHIFFLTSFLTGIFFYSFVSFFCLVYLYLRLHTGMFVSLFIICFFYFFINRFFTLKMEVF